MKLVLTIFGLMVVLVFGAISLVDNSSLAGAVPAPSATTHCNDDGDDDLPSNPEPVDGPDSEENLDPPAPGERNEEEADPEDLDPSYESDDEAGCIIGGVLGETATPEPCPSPIVYYAGSGVEDNCCPDTSNQGGQFTCICSDSAGGEVNAEYTCYCEHGNPLDCLCEINQLAVVPDCCQEFGYYCGGSLPGDADCDGSVTAADAYETLVVLSGFESSGSCGGGDADCSDAVDARDTLTILAVVAGLAEAPAC